MRNLSRAEPTDHEAEHGRIATIESPVRPWRRLGLILAILGSLGFGFLVGRLSAPHSRVLDAPFTRSVLVVATCTVQASPTPTDAARHFYRISLRIDWTSGWRVNELGQQRVSIGLASQPLWRLIDLTPLPIQRGFTRPGATTPPGRSATAWMKSVVSRGLLAETVEDLSDSHAGRWTVDYAYSGKGKPALPIFVVAMFDVDGSVLERSSAVSC